MWRRGEHWSRVGRLDIHRRDQVASMAFLLAEGREILVGVRASLLEEDLRFAPKLGAEPENRGWGISGASVTCRSQESRRCSQPTHRTQGHAHSHSLTHTHSLSQARMNELLTMAGPLEVLWGGNRPMPEKG